MAYLQNSTEGTSSTVPQITREQLDLGYGSQQNASTSQHHTPIVTATVATDFGSYPVDTSALMHSAFQEQNLGRFNEEWDASQHGSSVIEGHQMNGANSVMSQGDTLLPSRGGTLKKKASLKRKSSLGLARSGSRRSSKAGSVRSLALQPDADDEEHSAFFSPVPTTGNPTEILANRFQGWRKVLKDLITYFREIQASYDHKGKNLLKISNVINNTSAPPMFLQSGGLDDALQVLRAFHKQSIAEANKSKSIEEDVILALTGLRSDLQQKIKEIKNLSGDFKNSVDKEMDGTRRLVQQLGEALGQSDVDSAQMTGKQDPYLLKLQVDRQVEKQIDEENYLHQAYLNLEASGRELEAIVVGEIQKSYNALAGILKREADESYDAIEKLRTGPIAMTKDHEWTSFVKIDDHFIDPRTPVRRAQSIHYPGRDHDLATEVRAGLLERKSKYLKSYTAGWYVLSPTHLHEFKSADKSQAPIMSLYLPEQKLGSHSNEGGSSNKFMLKGRQTGSMHRGHSWVFRAESHDTMMAWYEDIKSLTEKTPQERNAFVRQHARSISGTSKPASVSSDGVMDEDDDEPFSAAESSVVVQGARQDVLPKRPEPGGRFPSDIQVNAQRGLQAPLSPSSGSSGYGDVQDSHLVNAPANLLGGGHVVNHLQQRRNSAYGMESPGGAMEPSQTSKLNHYAEEDGVNPYTYQSIPTREMYENNGGLAAGSGSTLGTGVVAAYRDHQAINAPEVTSLDENRILAAHEATKIATPDTTGQAFNERLASLEAVKFSAPDTDISSGPDFTSRNREVSGASSGVSHTNEQQAQNMPDPIETVPRSVAGKVQRPSLADTLKGGQRHSRMSVSQLHIPGEFPKATPAEEVGESLAFPL